MKGGIYYRDDQPKATAHYVFISAERREFVVVHQMVSAERVYHFSLGCWYEPVESPLYATRLPKERDWKREFFEQDDDGMRYRANDKRDWLTYGLVAKKSVPSEFLEAYDSRKEKLAELERPMFDGKVPSNYRITWAK